MQIENTLQNIDKTCLPSNWKIIKGGMYPMPLIQKNWAFIDFANIQKETAKARLSVNWEAFRRYLYIELSVEKAVIFLGYIEQNTFLYNRLEKAGFGLQFRKVIVAKDGSIQKGNIDPDLSGYAMDYKREYNKAVIIADDGDYQYIIESLSTQQKLECIISPHTMQRTSRVIKDMIPSKKIINIYHCPGVISHI